MNKIYPFFLNGQKYLTSKNITILDLVNYFGYNRSLLVIEYNHFICKNTQWNKISVKENDQIEIVTIVGGG